MQLERQLKIALDDSGLLILGAQVLFGFQFSGAFQDQSKELPAFSRAFVGAGLTLIMTAVALLIAPSMQHRIVERGQVATARYVVAAPLPLRLGSALVTYVAAGRALQSDAAALILAVAAALVLFGTWYAYPVSRWVMA
jgi:small neutral amino acid transporter SnatA (MarC family)